MPSHTDEYFKILNNLLEFEEVHACMLAKKGMDGFIPDTSKFNSNILGIWELLDKVMENQFNTIEQFSEINLNTIHFEIGDYDVWFYVLPGTDSALVAIIPANANQGLIQVKLENARRHILQVMQGG